MSDKSQEGKGLARSTTDIVALAERLAALLEGSNSSHSDVHSRLEAVEKKLHDMEIRQTVIVADDPTTKRLLDMIESSQKGSRAATMELLKIAGVALGSGGIVAAILKAMSG